MHHDGFVALTRNFKSEPLHETDGRTVGPDAQGDRVQTRIGPNELGEEGGADAALAVAGPDHKGQLRSCIRRLFLELRPEPDRAEERFFCFVESHEATISGAAPALDEARIFRLMDDLPRWRCLTLAADRLVEHVPEDRFIMRGQWAKNVIGGRKHFCEIMITSFSELRALSRGCLIDRPARDVLRA